MVFDEGFETVNANNASIQTKIDRMLAECLLDAQWVHSDEYSNVAEHYYFDVSWDLAAIQQSHANEQAIQCKCPHSVIHSNPSPGPLGPDGSPVHKGADINSVSVPSKEQRTSTVAASFSGVNLQ